MSYLCDAFNIEINPQNREFVKNPYIPFPTLTYPIQPDGHGYVSVTPQVLTKARCFDVKYGSKNYFDPSYYTLNPIVRSNHGSTACIKS